MKLSCKKCGGFSLKEVPTENIHKFKVECCDCGSFVSWGKIKKDVKNGTYDFTITKAEEVSEKFLLFNLTNDDFVATKKIWKDENSGYWYDLKRFVKFCNEIEHENIFVVLCNLEGEKVRATLENVIKKGKRVIEIKSLDKLL